MIRVSVVVPVYNAEPFLEKALESILSQPEVTEVILVEDKSKDGSYALAKKLSEQHSSVRLYTHEGHVNKGASASRALGITKSSNEFVAFLDADDYYLPGRFKLENEIFKNNPDADGVYGATGFHYYSADGVIRYASYNETGLTTVSNFVEPTELFEVMCGLSYKAIGYFHLNALTIKKEIVAEKRAGNFNPEMGLHEDTEWIYRLALMANLYPGSIHTAIAMRGVHDDNRIVNNDKEMYTKFLMYNTLYTWSKNAEISKRRKDIIKLFQMLHKSFLVNYFFALFILICIILSFPTLICHKTFLRKIIERIAGKKSFERVFVLYKQFFKRAQTQ